uniref:Flavin-containing monooxygenase n=1 Tax=Quercus lobata TaxID=97700 RepID=A0A7N2R323_QUELO
MAIPTLLFEFQARWVAKVLSGKVALPTEEYMASSVEELYQHMDETGWPKHHTHKLQQDKFEYENWLVDQLGLPPLEEWREKMFLGVCATLIPFYGVEYRDTWDVDKWLQEFSQVTDFIHNHAKVN